MAKLPIAILGAGNVGSALARVWLAAGQEVIFGLPNPQSEKSRAAMAALGGKARAAQNQEAAAAAQVVALSVPWSAAREAIRACGNLEGKVVIDCTNPLLPDLSGLALGTTTSAGEQVALWAAGAAVVKAFNTIGAADFGKAQFGAQRADGFYCGDDANAKAIARDIDRDHGFQSRGCGAAAECALSGSACDAVDRSSRKSSGRREPCVQVAQAIRITPFSGTSARESGAVAPE